MLVDELRATFLVEGLTGDQLAALAGAGEVVTFAEGDELFREGEPADHLWILLEGQVELSRRSRAETTVVATMTSPGQWAGGLRAWGEASSGAGYRATGTALGHGRIFRVPSEELGRLVGEWFPFGKHMIVGVYQTIRGIDALARQRESLVALGTLAAGLAHEINNPSAASLRAVEELQRTCDSMLGSLADLARKEISAPQYVELDRLRRALAAEGVPDQSVVARMDREDTIGAWLEARGVDDAWELAPVFAGAGAGEQWLEQVEATVGPDALGPALRWAATTIGATSLLGELTESTNRIGNLVAAVKSYSQMDRASLQRCDLHEGIESTLVMLAPKLEGVAVERDYATDIPLVEAYAAELNQVWTNLVDNAVHAMGGQGTLRLVTRREGDDIVVEVVDSGHGMSADVQARAFEPFFTTKPAGQGTGLGLDISHRIVAERHHGEITFDSSPAGTTARVRLPISR